MQKQLLECVYMLEAGDRGNKNFVLIRCMVYD